MSDPTEHQMEPLAGAFEARVRVPGSKSLTNRALLLAALAEGESQLSGVLFADDTRLMMRALQALGYELEIDEDAAEVWVGGGGPGVMEAGVQADLHLGNAGTAMRFLTGAACLGHGTVRLDGVPRMRERPIGELVDALRVLGAEIRSEAEEGYPPLLIRGLGGRPSLIPDEEGPGGVEGGDASGPGRQAIGWRARRLELPTMKSSQYVSSLLQIGPYLPRGLELELGGDVTSQPYIRMTVKLMGHFGARVDAVRGYRGIRVSPLPYRGADYAVEPDASSASYFLAAAAVTPGSRVTVSGLGSESLQGDARFCDVLGRMGCGVEQTLSDTTVTAPTDGLKGITLDLNAMPDLAQTLAAVAVFAEGPTLMRNIGNLRVKETDRLAAIRDEWQKWGCRVVVDGDDLTLHPPAGGPEAGARIATYDDHRMAMSAAVVGLRAPGVTIEEPGCVAKSYPGFFEDLEQLRA